ncbi:MAG: hypothetical protein HYY04_13745, partial [Chloroflexi bacterium]|nr:hypothetical protein [Chloroflexota bacterium]
MPIPAGLSPIEAAGIPVVFTTAWACLFERARLRAGEWALIQSGGGGVGRAGTQHQAEGGHVWGSRPFEIGEDPRRNLAESGLHAIADELGQGVVIDAAIERVHPDPQQFIELRDK